MTGFAASLLAAAWRGHHYVTMQSFDLERFCELVAEHRPTRAHLVPPIILGLAKHPVVDAHDFSSLKMIISAAAPLGADIEAECASRLGCGVKQAWGMSELSPLGTLTPDDNLKSGSGTVGPPASNTFAKVIDVDTGASLPVGESGELCIKGPQVMKGYLGEGGEVSVEKTSECIDADGWMRTGDIARLDEDGYVYIVDRLKELIKYKGFQVAPAELEEVVLSHDDVADATVIPVPDDEAGEVPRAYVVLKPDTALAEDVLAAWVAERVAPHKKLRGGVVYTDEIPKTASGKILRRVVIENDRAASS